MISFELRRLGLGVVGVMALVIPCQQCARGERTRAVAPASVREIGTTVASQVEVVHLDRDRLCQVAEPRAVQGPRALKLTIANCHQDAVLFTMTVQGTLSFVRKLPVGEVIDVDTTDRQHWVAIFRANPGSVQHVVSPRANRWILHVPGVSAATLAPQAASERAAEKPADDFLALTVGNVRKESALLFTLDGTNRLTYQHRLDHAEAKILDAANGQRWIAVYTDRPASMQYVVSPEETKWILR